jgi:hypothetical protein
LFLIFKIKGMSGTTKINAIELANATAELMHSNSIQDLTEIPSSRNNMNNIWNVIAQKFINGNRRQIYILALNIQVKWRRSNSFVSLVKKKLTTLQNSVENETVENMDTLENQTVVNNNSVQNQNNNSVQNQNNNSVQNQNNNSVQNQNNNLVQNQNNNLVQNQNNNSVQNQNNNSVQNQNNNSVQNQNNNLVQNQNNNLVQNIHIIDFFISLDQWKNLQGNNKFLKKLSSICFHLILSFKRICI